MDQWVIRNNGVAFKFGRADAISMVNCGSYIKFAGLYLTDGTGSPAGQPCGWCVNYNCDTCVYGAVIYSTNASVGWQFVNFTALPTAGLPTYPQSVSPLFIPSGGVSPPVVGWAGGSIGMPGSWTSAAPVVNVALARVHVTGVDNVPNSAATMGGALTFANQQPLRFTDASGAATTGIVLQNDNNLVIAGSGSTGAARNIAAMNQHSDTSSFGWLVPVVHNAATTFAASPVVANSIWSQWLDTAGSPIQMAVLSDNGLYWYGTNASGAPRTIMGMQQRSNTSVCGWSVPMQFVSTVGFNNTTPIAKPAGWAAATGTATRSTFVTSSVTLATLAEHVKALIDDLTAYGLIGP